MDRRWLATVLIPAISLTGILAFCDDDVSVVGAGHSALWHNPQRNGEGLVLEILGPDEALVYWYTYDESGGQRWLIGSGEIRLDESGQWIEFPELIVTHGGEFGPGFDPELVEYEVAGRASLRFASCDQGQFDFQAFGQELNISVERLTRSMGADCQSPLHGHPLRVVTDDAGLSGSWYDPARSGEGFALQWLSRDEVLITWYTYDRDGNQMWLIGVGRREDDRVIFEELSISSGARFGAEFDPEDVDKEPWGWLELVIDCEVGAVTYGALDATLGEGEKSLTRLSQLVRPACPPELAKLEDLYDFELTDLPVKVPAESAAPHWREPRYVVKALADDGTVAGLRPMGIEGSHPWLWRPGDIRGQEHSLMLPMRPSMFFDPDGESLYTYMREMGDIEGPLLPVRWKEGDGWKPLPAFDFHSSMLRGRSADGRILAGRGQEEPNSNLVPFLWDLESGQRPLALPLAATGPASSGGAKGVSNDGARVAGSVAFPGVRDAATFWVDGEAELLRDSYDTLLNWVGGCAADCTIVYGGFQAGDVLPDHPYLSQAWLWSEELGAEYLGELPDGAPWWHYFVTQASADASLVAGGYQIVPSGHTSGPRVFLWTRATGIVALHEILEPLGINHRRWSDMRVQGISSDGRLILLRATGNALFNYATEAWLLELVPRRELHE